MVRSYTNARPKIRRRPQTGRARPSRSYRPKRRRQADDKSWNVVLVVVVVGVLARAPRRFAGTAHDRVAASGLITTRRTSRAGGDPLCRTFETRLPSASADIAEQNDEQEASSALFTSGRRPGGTTRRRALASCVRVVTRRARVPSSQFTLTELVTPSNAATAARRSARRSMGNRPVMRDVCGSGRGTRWRPRRVARLQSRRGRAHTRGGGTSYSGAGPASRSRWTGLARSKRHRQATVQRLPDANLRRRKSCQSGRRLLESHHRPSTA